MADARKTRDWTLGEVQLVVVGLQEYLNAELTTLDCRLKELWDHVGDLHKTVNALEDAAGLSRLALTPLGEEGCDDGK